MRDLIVANRFVENCVNEPIFSKSNMRDLIVANRFVENCVNEPIFQNQIFDFEKIFVEFFRNSNFVRLEGPTEEW